MCSCPNKMQNFFANKKLRKFVPIFLFFIFLTPIIVQAQNGIIPPCGQRDSAGKFQPECGFDDLVILVNNIIDYLIMIAIPISASVFAWAGFKLMTTGVVDQRGEAKTMMKKVAIGLAIMLSAWLITNTIVKVLFAPGYTDIINK